MEREDINIVEGVEFEEQKELEEMEELEEDEPQTWMVILITLGVIIFLAVVIGIIFVFGKSDKNTEEVLASEVETETVVSEEETLTEEYSESETVTLETEEIILETDTQSIMKPETITEESMAESEGTSVDAISIEETETVSEGAFMEFADVADTVTAKDVTNLRLTPSTVDEGNIISQLINGQTAERIGINEATGWSQLLYNGQTVYAVSNFLTTDLDYKTPLVAGDVNWVTTLDGRIIIFTDCDDYITPKEYVNLRVEPSTTEGDSTVRCQINNGDKVHRTGYSPDSGWSRVEYNGEILYVVSSMIYGT